MQVNRFAYDMQQDKMAKINSQFRFGDVLDLDAVLPREANHSQLGEPFSQSNKRNGRKNQGKLRNKYHLHSILIHRGTLGAGHYFAFIKPSHLNDAWYEFNDSEVTPMVKSTALSIGAGGFDSLFETKDGVI